MARVRIERFDKSAHGVFGRLSAPGFACFTGELPDFGNACGISCIPSGFYRVGWAWSPRLRRYTFRLFDVPSRSGVLIHPANLMGDRAQGFKAQLAGCIALGEKIGTMDGQKALLVSAPAVRRFEALMGKNTFDLEIVNA